MKRTNYSSGAPLEDVVGYSRMVKVGDFIFVGGTTAVQPDGSVYGEGDSYAQAKYILEKMVKLVEQAGASVEDVIAVKFYATPEYNGMEGGRAYTEIFKSIKPLNTMVKIHSLNRPTQLIEVEMTAVVGCGK